MKFDAFFGGSYQSQAATADQERTINLYPEVLQSQGATSRLALYPTPGVRVIATPGSGYGRAHYGSDDTELAVIGHEVYAIDAGGTASLVSGWARNDDRPATISFCPEAAYVRQYLITSGGEVSLISQWPDRWLPGSVVDPVTGAPVLVENITHGGFLDGRFIVLNSVTSTIYISAIFSGTSWATGTDFAQRTLAPDPWRALKVVGRYIWLFGEVTTEIWQDTGANFPFAPFPSSLLPYGIAAPYSAALVGNGVVWLANTTSGKRCVVYASGQNPEIISTYPLETALSGYTDLSTAVGDSYSDKGHTFYLLSIPEEPETTFVWDLETKLWHERGTWRPEQNRYESWRPRFHAFAYGEHRMLDSSGNSVYHMDSNLTRDVDSLAIRRVRRAPAIQAENKRVYFSSLEVDVEPGHGLTRPGGVAFGPGGASVPLGSSTFVSFTMSKRTGRLVSIDDGDCWTNNFSLYDIQQSAHDLLLSDVVFLLTGKRTGASVLIVAANATGIFGSQFSAGLNRLGHTSTYTLAAFNLGGYVMTDFDMTCMHTLVAPDDAAIDPHLAAGGAILTVLEGLNNVTWTRYGFATSATTTQTFAPAPSYDRPMTCAALGGGPYHKVVFTSPTYISTAVTIGVGTRTIYANDLTENMAAIWELA